MESGGAIGIPIRSVMPVAPLRHFFPVADIGPAYEMGGYWQSLLLTLLSLTPRGAEDRCTPYLRLLFKGNPESPQTTSRGLIPPAATLMSGGRRARRVYRASPSAETTPR